MKILFDWLKEFVDIDVPLDAFVREMTLVGVAVEAVSEAGGSPLLDLEITTNRPDLLSHYGVAREAAARFGKKLKPIAPAPREAADPAASAAQVEIADAALCNRYVALLLRNVNVAPSPPWLAQRLEACGIAVINNIVDVTNLSLIHI